MYKISSTNCCVVLISLAFLSAPKSFAKNSDFQETLYKLQNTVLDGHLFTPPSSCVAKVGFAQAPAGGSLENSHHEHAFDCIEGLDQAADQWKHMYGTSWQPRISDKYGLSISAKINSRKRMVMMPVETDGDPIFLIKDSELYSFPFDVNVLEKSKAAHNENSLGIPQQVPEQNRLLLRMSWEG